LADIEREISVSYASLHEPPQHASTGLLSHFGPKIRGKAVHCPRWARPEREKGRNLDCL
jgi:hypothetical protein